VRFFGLASSNGTVQRLGVRFNRTIGIEFCRNCFLGKVESLPNLTNPTRSRCASILQALRLF
jgi:hypothetical protein